MKIEDLNKSCSHSQINANVRVQTRLFEKRLALKLFALLRWKFHLFIVLTITYITYIIVLVIVSNRRHCESSNSPHACGKWVGSPEIARTRDESGAASAVSASVERELKRVRVCKRRPSLIRFSSPLILHPPPAPARSQRSFCLSLLLSLYCRRPNEIHSSWCFALILRLSAKAQALTYEYMYLYSPVEANPLI